MKQTFIKQIVALFFISSAMAQVPDTDIYLVQMKFEKGEFKFENTENITFRKGYDNQPRFNNDGSLLYYVSQLDTTQTDIFAFDIATKETLRITNTPESEYSPTPLSGNKKLGCVRVNANDSQHFYTYTLDGKTADNVTPENDSIGYFCQASKNQFLFFVLGEKFTLQMFDSTTHQYSIIDSNIGRCMLSIPKSNAISYTQKTNDSTAVIMKLDLKSLKKTVIAQAIIGSEDFAWTADGKLIIGSKGKLFVYNFDKKNWKEIGDFSSSVGNFYRIAISPKGDWLALVAYAGKKP